MGEALGGTRHWHHQLSLRVLNSVLRPAPLGALVIPPRLLFRSRALERRPLHSEGCRLPSLSAPIAPQSPPLQSSFHEPSWWSPFPFVSKW